MISVHVYVSSDESDQGSGQGNQRMMKTIKMEGIDICQYLAFAS
jgi:hypothetical protein